MNAVCGDNRFEIIAKVKEHLVKATNIEMQPEELKYVDNVLFRLWQLGYFDSVEKISRLEEQVEDLKSDHEHNLGLMKGLNEKIAELNKANEWHYPSKGELPKCDEKTQLIFYVNCYYEIGGETIIRKRTVLGYYQNSFLNDDVKLFVEKSKGYSDEHLPKDVIAWKEIVLPEFPKENE